MITLQAITSRSEEDTQTIAELRTRIAGLRETNATLMRRVEEARDLHRSDIATIGETLMDEADKREWCDEYDSIVQGLNRHLHVELPLRKREYTVTVNVQVVITVEATDEDDARSEARDIARDAEKTVDGLDGVYTSHWDDSYSYEIARD